MSDSNAQRPRPVLGGKPLPGFSSGFRPSLVRALTSRAHRQPWPRYSSAGDPPRVPLSWPGHRFSPKERFVHWLFDAISGRYDLFNRISSLGLDQGWRRRTIASLELTPGMRVLDLASGTGDLSRWAATDLVPLGGVISCDLSYPMLRSSRRKFERVPAAHWHVQLTQAKAEALPFADKVFDAATIGFALRNVSNLDTVFQELYRVMKPGGHLGLLEFGRTSNPLLRVGQRLWLTTGVPLIGALTTGKLWPFLYLRRSILEFMPPKEVIRRLQAAGFSEAKANPFSGGIVYLYTATRP